MDLWLVNMPLAGIERPMLSLSLLAEILKNAGMKTKVSYGNMQYFALLDKHIDKHTLKNINNFSSELAFGDWLFKPNIFDTTENDTDYLDFFSNLLQGTKLYGKFFSDYKQIMNMRKIAVEFVDDFALKLVKDNPKIVGCSSMFDQHIAALSLLKKIKALNPNIVTMIGGPNCEGKMGESTHKLFEWVDFVISGYCDDFIAPLCKEIIKNGIDIPDCLLNSQVYAPKDRDNGYDREFQITNHTVNLDKLPIPDYSAYFDTLNSLPELKKITKPTLPVEGSRGCSWGRCHFCGLNGKHVNYHKKSWERLYNEIHTLASRHKVDFIELVDNEVHIGKATPLLEMLKNDPIPYKIFCEVRPTIKKNDIKKMRDAGFIWVQPGIESLSDELLHSMKKGTSILNNIQTLKWCLQYGIQTIWSVMFYFPNDSDKWYEDMRSVIELLTHLGAPKGMNKLRIDRFSAYYKNQEKYNLDLIPYEHYSIIYPFDEQTINNLVYYFENKQDVMFRKKPALSILLGKRYDGLHNVGSVVAEWIESFQKNDKDILEYRRTGDKTLIHDTRPIAVKKYHELDEVHSQVYLACDKALSVKDIKNEFGNIDDKAIDAALKSLVNSKLMLEHKGKYLSLAVEADDYQLATDDMFPCGYLASPELSSA